MVQVFRASVLWRHPAGPVGLLLAIAVLVQLVAAPPAAAACSPRPPVQVNVQRDPGRLLVSVSATTNANTPSNQITALRFGDPRAMTNALVDVANGPQAQSSAFTYTPATPGPGFTFVVRPIAAGQPATVPLVVVDACNDWPTLVGGGTDGFAPATAVPPPTAVPPTAVPQGKATTPSLSAPATDYVTGDQITARWGDVPSPAPEDWIGLFRADDVNHANDFLGDKIVFTGATGTGERPIVLPTEIDAGVYQLRLFRAKTKSLIAASHNITIVKENPLQPKDAKGLEKAATGLADAPLGAASLGAAPPAPPLTLPRQASPLSDLPARGTAFADSAAANDNISAAVSVGGTLPFQAILTTAAAGTEGGEPTTCGSAPIGKTVWYALRTGGSTATSTSVTIDTIGSDFDTVLAVYTGGPGVGALSPVTCADDVNGRLARVSFTAQPTTTYYVQVGGYAGASGSLVIRFARTPGLANDNFAGRIAINGPTGQDLNKFTDAATSEALEPTSCNAASIRKTLWYAYTPGAGEMIVDTTGSDFDTILGVYTGSGPSSFVPVICNDDRTTLQARLTFSAQAGVTYYVQVGGYNGAAGTLSIRFAAVPPPANDNFAQRTAIATFPNQDVLFTEGARTESIEPVNLTCDGQAVKTGKTVWYSFTSPTTRTVTIDTFGSDFDTVLALYEGTSLGSLSLRDCNDDTNGRASLVSWVAQPGVNYVLQVGGYQGTSASTLPAAAAGRLVLRLNLTPNDAFGQRTTLAKLPTRFEQNNDSATTEGGAGEPLTPTCGGSPTNVGKTLWYQLPIGASPINLTIDTAGSSAGSFSLDTVLAVYRGSSLGGLTFETCNDDVAPSDRTSSVTFVAQANTTYHVQVGGYSGAAGRIALNFRVVPLNDNFANAVSVTTIPSSFFTASTLDATLESWEPTSLSGCTDGNPGIGRSVWYKVFYNTYTPLAVTTIGSDYDTVIAVWRYNTGTGNLEFVACNDQFSASSSQSYVEFDALINEQYYIQVSGYRVGADTSFGRLLTTFLARRPPNDNFPASGDPFGVNAAVSSFPTQFRVFTGAATLQSGEPSGPVCGGVAAPTGRTAWYSVTSSTTRSVTIDTAGSNFDTVVAVYTGGSVGGLSLVACNDDVSAANRQSLLTFTAQADVTYRVQVGGFGGRAGAEFVTFR